VTSTAVKFLGADSCASHNILRPSRESCIPSLADAAEALQLVVRQELMLSESVCRDGVSFREAAGPF